VKKDGRNEEIDLKIQRALAALDDARFLAQSGRNHSAVNRLYYAAFYALSALAQANGFDTGKHSQLIGWFNKNFVNSGRIDRETGKTAHTLFDMRTKSDYDVFADFDDEEMKEIIERTKSFVEKILGTIKDT
jgi:uncharacterized protein (UPF0332 family)